MSIFLKRKQSGFTLVEVLTVVTILSILIISVRISFQGARAIARDARRVADIRQITLALNGIYLKDKKFPCHRRERSTDPDIVGTTADESRFMNFLKDGGYMGADPADPINKGTSQYEYHTFHHYENTGTKCGEVAYLGFYTEKPINCSFISGAIQDSPNHCHIYLPRRPDGCPLTGAGGGTDCAASPVSDPQYCCGSTDIPDLRDEGGTYGAMQQYD